MPDFDTLQPEEQRNILLESVSTLCLGAAPEGNTLHYTSQGLYVSLEFGQA